MPEALFCPLSSDWGDIATWVGAVATWFAVWGLFRLANRDRDEREAARKSAERVAATALVPYFTQALAIFPLFQMFRSGLPPGAVENIDQYANRMREGLLGLELGRRIRESDISSLSVEIAQLVRLSEAALITEQARFAPGGRWAVDSGMDLVQQLATTADGLIPHLTTTGSILFGLVNPGHAPPWAQQSNAQ